MLLLVTRLLGQVVVGRCLAHIGPPEGVTLGVVLIRAKAPRILDGVGRLWKRLGVW